MVWRLGATVLLFYSVSCNTGTEPRQGQVETKSDEKISMLNIRPSFLDNKKVTATHGSMLPPNPELIVNMPSNFDEHNQKRKELERMKKSSKFRNAALGSIIGNLNDDVNNHEAEVVSNEEEVEKSSTTTAITTLKEEEPVTTLETTTTPIPTPTPTTTSEFSTGSISELNRQIAERAAKRQQIKEEGYKKYEQIVFKKGRNIVPVRLFFDTDPFLPSDQKKSKDISSSSASSSADVKAVGDEITIKDSPIAANKAEDENKKLLIRNSTEFDHINKTAVVGEDQVIINENTEFESEDVDGSGVLPMNESIDEPHTALLSEEKRHSLKSKLKEEKSAEKQSLTTTVTSLSSEFVTSAPSDSDRSHNMTTLTLSAADNISEPASSVNITSPLEQTTNNTVTLESQLKTDGILTDSVNENDTSTANITSLETNVKNRTDIRSLLIAPLSPLSTFPSLNTPLTIADVTQLKNTSDEKLSFDKQRNRTSKLIGISLQRNRSRKRLRLGSTSLLGIVDSHSVKPFSHKGDTVKPFKRQHSTEIQPSTNSTPSKITSLRTHRFIQSKKGSRRIRPVFANRAIPIIIHRITPGHQNFKETFKIDPLRKVPILTRSKTPFVSNTPVVQRKRVGINSTKLHFSPEQKRNLFFTAVSSQLPSSIRRGPTKSQRILRENRYDTNSLQPQQRRGTDDMQKSSIKTFGISLVQAYQKEDEPFTRTSTPPFSSVDELKVVKPQNDVFPVLKQTDWKRIRSEFLKIKHQIKLLRQKQRSVLLPNTSTGVKTSLSDGSIRSLANETHQPETLHKNSTKAIKRKEANATHHSEDALIKVDPFRHIIERDIILKS